MPDQSYKITDICPYKIAHRQCFLSRSDYEPNES
jgi:hypothetical protein